MCIREVWFMQCCKSGLFEAKCVSYAHLTVGWTIRIGWHIGKNSWER